MSRCPYRQEDPVCLDDEGNHVLVVGRYIGQGMGSWPVETMRVWWLSSPVQDRVTGIHSFDELVPLTSAAEERLAALRVQVWPGSGPKAQP